MNNKIWSQYRDIAIAMFHTSQFKASLRSDSELCIERRGKGWGSKASVCKVHAAWKNRVKRLENFYSIILQPHSAASGIVMHKSPYPFLVYALRR